MEQCLLNSEGNYFCDTWYFLMSQFSKKSPFQEASGKCTPPMKEFLFLQEGEEIEFRKQNVEHRREVSGIHGKKGRLFQSNTCLPGVEQPAHWSSVTWQTEMPRAVFSKGPAANVPSFECQDSKPGCDVYLYLVWLNHVLKLFLPSFLFSTVWIS